MDTQALERVGAEGCRLRRLCVLLGTRFVSREHLLASQEIRKMVCELLGFFCVGISGAGPFLRVSDTMLHGQL